MNTHSYIGIYQDPPQDDGSMRLWRPDVLNPRLREQLASPYAAEAARWWDALEDAHEQRDREEGCVAPPRSTSIRNFDAATWRLVSRCCTGGGGPWGRGRLREDKGSRGAVAARRG
jgi:hypothetical protein